jgi:urease accessory protein UreF
MEQTLQTAPLARAGSTRWLGQWHPLVGQIGLQEATAPATFATTACGNDAASDLSSLRAFLLTYKTQVLVREELPVLTRAQRHAARNEFRELLALDRELSQQDWLRELQERSRRAGRAHLACLRPLRDQRLVQRYLHAVQEGQAHGWHVTVAGLALSVYSIPLRQGLLDYAVHTLWSAVGRARLCTPCAPRDLRELVQELTGDLTHALRPLLEPLPAPVG